MTKAKKTKSATQGILKKKITELTLADFAVIERPLGTPQFPFPMFGPQRVEHEKSSSLQMALSTLSDGLLKVYSERPHDEVMALAYCDMPVPSMLPLFKDALERRGDPLERQRVILEGKEPQNDNYNRTQMMIGDPGAGKSFMSALMGRLRGASGVEIYDCGGKNMNDLLFEMVLDFGAGDPLPKAIDKRLQAGTLQPLSITVLKSLPGASLDENGGLVGIDWAFVGGAGPESVEAAFEALKKVSKIEGLDNAGGNALGMNSQYGPLIRAFLENREIVLDEYNKSREGSDNALQTVIQFLIGELRETTVDNPLKNKDNTSGPSSFTFKRDDMGAGFFVTFTGNKTEDGVTTRSLNKSVYDRLKPDTLPDPSIIDWQHRICQMMVGMPVSTLYKAFETQADKNPDAFGEWLMAMRKKKAEIEGVPVPELQQSLLANWKNVLHASEKLAKFYDRWAAMTDASKITSNGNADLVEEVDDEYSKKEAMSFRRIKQHLEESIPIRSRMNLAETEVAVDFASWDKPPAAIERTDENASLNFGTRLVEYIERMVAEKSAAVGKMRLYEKLTKQMEIDGLRDAKLLEGERSKQKAVEQDLNISSFADRDLSKQAQMARKVFCDYIRQIDPEIVANDDQIVTQNKFLDALRAVSKQDTGVSKDVFVVNRDHEALYAGRPFTAACVVDTAQYEIEGRDGLDFGLDDVAHHDDFMASLALPTVSVKNLGAIWEGNTRLLLERQGTALTEGVVPTVDKAPAGNNSDQSLLMTENRSGLGLAITSLQLRVDEQAQTIPVHIIHNAARNKTLIVGERVPSKLSSAFKEAGIVHVDRKDVNAKVKIDAALSDLTRGILPDDGKKARSRTIKDELNDAFKYRNGVKPEYLEAQRAGASRPTDRAVHPRDEDFEDYLGEQQYLKDKSIADLMVDPNIAMTHPKFVVRKKAA